MANIKKTNQHEWGCEELEPFTLLAEMGNGAPPWETAGQGPALK